ncbi:uncharacterized protein V6R79_002753 [Siganus canaliculatus]
MDKGKVFNDPIHGHIELHPLLLKIIDTPQFQRLRYIKQMGGAYYVYPGASHNRFEHSLGVAHLAGQLVSALQSQQKELRINSRDVLCVMIAGLCHDLGHGPFSHMFDKFIKKVEKETEPKPEDKLAWEHEYRSCMMFDHLVEENNLEEVMKENGLELPEDMEFIKDLIDPQKVCSDKSPQAEGKTEEKPKRKTGRSIDKSFLYDIVANKRNGIDVDKWDYFARDCYHLGITNNFNYQRFLKFARVCKVDGEKQIYTRDKLGRVYEVDAEKQICTRDKEAANLYDMFHTRYNIHRMAAHHRVTNIIQLMITDAFIKADKHIKREGKDGETFTLSTAIYDMEAFTKLTDQVFEEILYSPKPELEEARKILKRIQTRKLYQCLGELKSKDSSKKGIKRLKKDLTDALTKRVKLEDFEVMKINLNYGMGDKDPVKSMCFYTKANPGTASELPPEKESKFLPQSFCESMVRAFFKKQTVLDAQTAAKTAKAAEDAEAAEAAKAATAAFEIFKKKHEEEGRRNGSETGGSTTSPASSSEQQH